MTNLIDDDELRLSIEMALSKIKTKPRGDRDGTYRKIVAEQIVAHLKLSNWRFVKGPPLPAHPIGLSKPPSANREGTWRAAR